MTAVEGSIALVTGGQRGIGKAFVERLLARGATKVYATARDPRPSDDPRVEAVFLDVTHGYSVTDLAEKARDVDIVINNAGVLHPAPLLTGDLAQVFATFDTNVYGPLRVAQAFAPILADNGGGALVNIHSLLSWAAGSGAYGASKAALWSLTNSLRIELAAQHTQVVGVHLGFADTEMVAAIPTQKIAPTDVARIVLDGVERGESEVLVDEVTRTFKAALAGPVEGLALPAPRR
ncbi:SDR family oxidoreductase [Streptomyces griseoviridis]|jgi:NAD(P)-dependent dehydrogenase (short-subunit alcohol dehydrogenase family)|uniref:Short chain dehydrogenase/reductase n=3 Tax=Streptomyces TaxID=1883 RepID=A0A918G958_STRGD|nr:MULTISPECIES: SDR family oxidoreductase [Streptomyces]MDP9683681.1 NAD(P)-dependent dehydrogenase (short-subunit alcohol dehydrogenase family) [Streptomyces griseoviridis]GGS24774.1 putative short chain dehydrogenase/reductase [Streptomyces niveoruber]GGS93115.1 putative short chain dehydrogenase/reductase [Streptomyces griseoviridis]GGU22226.1 putative short chain dehydrogenase/reductase [Streptomyces daghestanicus]GHI31370.1 putative short chain dehydrogenase/reductase [Streptomyces daghe